LIGPNQYWPIFAGKIEAGFQVILSCGPRLLFRHSYHDTVQERIQSVEGNLGLWNIWINNSANIYLERREDFFNVAFQAHVIAGAKSI